MGDKHGIVFGLAGFSGAGKTTLAEGLIKNFKSKGMHVATIKHAHHHFDADTPGKDSWRHRKAGAEQVIVASKNRQVHFIENEKETAPNLPTLLDTLSPTDVVIIEGFKNIDFPKVEIYRQELGREFLYPTLMGIFLIATDTHLTDCPLPQADLSDVAGLATTIIESLKS